MVTIFTLHLLGAIPNAGPYLEFSVEGEDCYPWQSELFTTDIVARDGCVQIPKGPGSAMEINPKCMASAKYRKSEL